MSSHSDLASLPVELLLEIVQFVLQDSHSYIDIFRLCHVDSKLRAAVTGCSSLWSSLWFNDTAPSFELAKLGLSRSNGHNLNISIQVESEEFESGFGLQLLEFLASIRPSTVRTLSITHTDPYLPGREQCASACLEQLDTSMLEDLKIVGPCPEWEQEPQSDSLLLPPMPRLRRLILAGVAPEWADRVPMEALTHMSFANPGYDVSMVEIQRMLLLVPNIEELRFDGTALGDWKFSPPFIQIPKLLRLVLGVGDAFTLAFLQGMDAPRLETISLTHSRPLKWDEIQFEDPVKQHTLHKSVRCLDIQTVRGQKFNGYSAYLFPKAFPNIEAIVIPAESCGFLDDVILHASNENRETIWPHLQSITVVGDLNPHGDWYRSVYSLNYFLSRRYEIHEESNTESSSSLSLIVQSDDKNEVCGMRMIQEETIQYVAMAQVGEKTFVGELGIEDGED